MVLPVGDRRPFSMPVVKHVLIPQGTGATISGTMISRAPWPSPVNKYYVLRKIVATQSNAATSGGILNIWDQDMSNTTPVTRGSAGGPLLAIPITPNYTVSGSMAGSMTVLDIDACPQEFFQAGITCQQTVSGTVTVSVELDVI